MASAPPRVALVSAPIMSAEFPSFQIGLLKPTLERAGIEAQTFSLFMYFGTHVGWRLAEELSQVRISLVGEWIWTKAAFGDQADPRVDAYFETFGDDFKDFCSRAGCSIADIRRLREEVCPALCDFFASSIDWSRFDVIGFSVVFQQLLPSLAIAKRLKQRHPDTPIIMGGAAFETRIAEEVTRSCEQIDLIHIGDADESLPELVRRLSAGTPTSDLPGLVWRQGGEVKSSGRAPNFMEMDRTPTPDFDEYFYARRESGYAEHRGTDEVMLPVETARGCWWGAKHHCAYCGANPAGLEFRAKSVDKVVDMLRQLSERYGQRHFDFIDNIISPAYMRELFDHLAEAHTDYRFHFEIRPTLNRRMLKRMKEGGLLSVQPGIESLSTHVLQLMNKRSTGMRHVELIKWCTYYDLDNLYFILLRFAGEKEEDYQEQVEAMAKLHHLQPPRGITRARADPGSPMHMQPAEHGITRLFPERCYPYIFPAEKFDLDKVAYYFDLEMEGSLPDSAYDAIFRATGLWSRAWHQRPRPILAYRRFYDSARIYDTRSGQMRRSVVTGRVARLLEFCNDARSLEAIEEEFGPDDGWIAETLDALEKRDWLLPMDGSYLNLALPTNPHH